MMKKKLAILLAVLALVFGSAISSYSLGLSVGIKGGLGIANLYNYNSGGTENKAKLTGGLMAAFDIHFLSWLTCEVNLGWRHKGARIEDAVTGETAYYRSTEYFDMDFLAKIYLTPRQPLGFYILIGGYVGGPMKNSTSFTKNPPVVSDSTNASDVGMIFGGGVNIGLGKFSILIETYGTIGFKSAGSDRNSGSNSGPRYIAGYLMAGILFDF